MLSTIHYILPKTVFWVLLWGGDQQNSKPLCPAGRWALTTGMLRTLVQGVNRLPSWDISSFAPQTALCEPGRMIDPTLQGCKLKLRDTLPSPWPYLAFASQAEEEQKPRLLTPSTASLPVGHTASQRQFGGRTHVSALLSGWFSPHRHEWYRTFKTCFYLLVHLPTKMRKSRISSLHFLSAHTLQATLCAH